MDVLVSQVNRTAATTGEVQDIVTIADAGGDEALGQVRSQWNYVINRGRAAKPIGCGVGPGILIGARQAIADTNLVSVSLPVEILCHWHYIPYIISIVSDLLGR